MDKNLLVGTLVRLAADEPPVLAEAYLRWNLDAEYQMLSMIEPANQYSLKKSTDWVQKDQEADPPRSYYFSIHTLPDDRLIGSCGLGGEFFPHGEAFVGIGIGERELWGKGYGTDAMRVVLRYAFQELNMRRVSLETSEFNPRAVRSYEKAGFVIEGRTRGSSHRGNRRWDTICMGILREEWLAIDQ